LQASADVRRAGHGNANQSNGITILVWIWSCDACDGHNVERKYGDLGREKVQEHAMTDALAELIRCLEAG
jgi:hypothetical protein